MFFSIFFYSAREPSSEHASPALPKVDTRLFINNRFVDSQTKFATINPADGKVLTEVHEASDALVDEAVQAAHKVTCPFPLCPPLKPPQQPVLSSLCIYFSRILNASVLLRRHSTLVIQRGGRWAAMVAAA